MEENCLSLVEDIHKKLELLYNLVFFTPKESSQLPKRLTCTDQDDIFDFHSNYCTLWVDVYINRSARLGPLLHVFDVNVRKLNDAVTISQLHHHHSVRISDVKIYISDLKRTTIKQLNNGKDHGIFINVPFEAADETLSIWNFHRLMPIAGMVIDNPERVISVWLCCKDKATANRLYTWITAENSLSKT